MPSSPPGRDRRRSRSRSRDGSRRRDGKERSGGGSDREYRREKSGRDDVRESGGGGGERGGRSRSRSRERRKERDGDRDHVRDSDKSEISKGERRSRASRWETSDRRAGDTQAPPPLPPPSAAAAAAAGGGRGGHVAAAPTSSMAAIMAEGGKAAAAKKGPQDGGGTSFEWGSKEEGGNDEEGGGGDKPKLLANFGLSGALSKDKATGNVYKGIVLKWSEPEDARQPSKRWRLYVFKGQELLQTLHIHRQSAYLFGRERKIADIPLDHLSCSKQHAVLQFRLKEKVNAAAMKTTRTVRPYVMDLESANGTFLNGERVEASRYIELFEKDVIKFGTSTREYVLLHDKSSAPGGTAQGGGKPAGS